MEHSEDHEQLADHLEQESDALEQRNAELGGEIADVRDDWERKRADEGVPGAPPRTDDDAGGNASSSPQPESGKQD